jgi:flavin reductase (DIM6/NTAB) family NADH-FMN oxidoreductase RutF
MAIISCQNGKPEQTDTKITQLEWQQISPKEIKDNTVKLFADDWAVITSGTADKFNMMTASWGCIGNLWQRPVAWCFVRPQRYTFEFINNSPTYTLCFFDESYRDKLQYLGSVSGRDEDKLVGSGFTTKILPSGNIAYEEARLIIECKTLYADNFNENCFIDTTIVSGIYQTKDFHRVFIGEITGVWEKK